MHPYVPLYPGKSLRVRALNRFRRTLPRLTHFMEAIAGVRLAERKTGLVWRAVLRIPDPTPDDVISAPDLKTALPRLVTVSGPHYVNIGGLMYVVAPTNANFREVSGSLKQRAYQSYADYVRHQASKLEREEAAIRSTSERRFQKMAARFAEVSAAAHLGGRVLCLGARLGEEVRAFRHVGMAALGVDLNPGANNPNCLSADFHFLPFRDDSFDGAYSNVLDHVYDMDRFMRETVRVVRPGGFVLFELTGGFGETDAVDPYGATLWPTNAVLVQALSSYISEMILDQDDRARSRRVVVFRPSKAALTPSGGE